MALELKSPGRIVYEGGAGGRAQAAVCMALYNYRGYVTTALDSVAAQDLGHIELMVVDDCSNDDSAAVAEAWMRAQAGRFTRTCLMRPESNGGSGNARNLGVSGIRAPFVFMFDADNLLYPRCLRRHLEAISEGGASVAYGIIERFGEDPKLVGPGLMDHEDWRPERFIRGNYLDTMAMLRREHFVEVGGYAKSMIGWEDFDLYCTLVDHGFYGIHVPEILSRYRVHGSSKFHTTSNTERMRPILLKEITRRHPWLKLG